MTVEEIRLVVFLIALVYWGSFGAFCGWLAEEKGKDRVTWFWLGMVFGVIALLAIVGVPKVESSEEEPLEH